jgi:hypothetical protein
MKKEIIIKGFPIIDGVVRDSAIIEIPIPEVLHELARGDGDDWDKMCERLPAHGFMNPIGKMSIEQIKIDGEWRVFH